MNIKNQKESWIVVPLLMIAFLTLHCGGSKETGKADGQVETTAKTDGSAETKDGEGNSTETAKVEEAKSVVEETKVEPSTGTAEEATTVKADMKSLSRCKACHSISGSRIAVGPPLFGVVGRKAGAISKYQYGKTLKTGKWSWTEANLLTWLTKGSKKAVKSISGDSSGFTKMSFSPMSVDKAKATIAALKTLK